MSLLVHFTINMYQICTETIHPQKDTACCTNYSCDCVPDPDTGLLDMEHFSGLPHTGSYDD